MREFRIAVCMFGQIRTGLYCAEYIKSGYDMDGQIRDVNFEGIGLTSVKIKVDYFCHTKNYNTPGHICGKIYNNVTNVSDEDTDSILNVYNPISYKISDYESESKIIGWNMAFFNSLVSSINLKNQYELETGIRYDMCFCQRYDIVMKPASPINILFKKHMIRDNCIYTNAIVRMMREDNCLGIMDFWFGGDSFSVDLMSASLVRYISDLKRIHSDFNELPFGIGPNILLYNAIIENNILPLQFPESLMVTPVRENSDLSLSIADNVQYFNDFFVNNHPGIKPTKNKLI